MKTIQCPQINVNDESYLVNELYFQNGSHVKSGEIIVSVGSSKAVSEIESNGTGYILYLKNSSDTVSVGETIALLFDSIQEYEDYQATQATISQSNKPSFILTKPAQKFAQENNLSDQLIASLNKKIIKTEDLKNLVSNPKNPKEKLSLNQLITASKVMQSHQNIPQAFQLIKADCTKCDGFIESYRAEKGILIGYGEIMTIILAELFEEFPTLFAHWEKDNQIQKAAIPEIGITLDVGNGLFLPVIKFHQPHSIDEVAEIMLEYKLKAVDGSFEEEDLNGGNISISLNPARNMVSVIPLIFPGQAAMISVASPIKELGFDSKKNIVEKSFLYIGLCFDHRVINGSYAMKVLERIAEKIEKISFNTRSEG